MTQFSSKSSKKGLFSSILPLFLAIFALFAISSCSKSGTGESEETQMINFAKKHNINYTKDASGIFYEIITPGSSVHPTVSNTVTVTYVGTLMNDTQFDAGTASFPLSNLIQGWQVGIPKIGVGGEIKLLIPSSLGYGAAGAGSKIPGSAPLYFDIKLSAVK
jgi:FKBP-type peptidyl-prolyl cis-trans isomerase FkpA